MIFRNDKTPGIITHLLFLVFLAGLVFSWRAVCSISIMAILLWGLIATKGRTGTLFHQRNTKAVLCASFAYFLLQVVAVFYSNDRSSAWSNVQLKTGMLIMPLAVILCATHLKKTLRLLLWHYSLMILIAAAICLVNAWLTYRTMGNSNVFFYHELASPLSGHAIYLSILVTVAILFLVESFFSSPALPNRRTAICLVVFLLLFMMLLSSKLVLIFLFGYLFLVLTRFFHFNHFRRVTVVGSFGILILLIVLMLGTNNPVSRRFYDVIDGRLSMAWQNNFTPGDYFNGLQFRLLQWKLVPEILAERNRWLRGVGTGDAQDALNDKYLSRHMYAGDPDRGKKGYLAYNTHNQFLQTLLQTGIFGLVVLFVLIGCLARIAWNAIDKLPKAYTCLLIVWLFTEAPLETQYGIILVSFFPLLLLPENLLASVKANLLKRSSD